MLALAPARPLSFFTHRSRPCILHRPKPTLCPLVEDDREADREEKRSRGSAQVPPRPASREIGPRRAVPDARKKVCPKRILGMHRRGNLLIPPPRSRSPPTAPFEAEGSGLLPRPPRPIGLPLRLGLDVREPRPGRWWRWRKRLPTPLGLDPRVAPGSRRRGRLLRPPRPRSPRGPTVEALSFY